MTIYLESIFLDNFLPNFFLLYLSGSFLQKRRFLRAISGGAFGGIYAIFAAYFPILCQPWFKFAAGILMCILCFGVKKTCLKGSVRFFVASFLLGGIAFGLYYCTNIPSTNLEKIRRIVLISGICMLILLEILRRIQPKSITEAVSIRMRCGENLLSFTAEYDSGTVIRDEHGNGVILLNRNFAKTHLPQNIYADLMLCPSSSLYRTRFFTVQTAAGKIKLIGFRPDSLSIFIQDKTLETDCYILLADGIRLNGSPAIFGKDLKTEASS